jgi:hypothetical protein
MRVLFALALLMLPATAFAQMFEGNISDAQPHQTHTQPANQR